MRILFCCLNSASFWLALLLTLAQAISAQERPAFTTAGFDYSVSHRQNVCDLEKAFHNGTVELRNALRDFELRPIMAVDDRFFKLDENGAISQSEPAIITQLLDELARRAGFTWRDSYGIITSIYIPENETYTNLLKWSVEIYDVSASYWIKTIQRMALGISFPEGWYDTRIIMVGKKPDGTTRLDVWSFLEPFSYEVWIMITVTLFLSGLIYVGLESFDPRSDKKSLQYKPGESIFLSCLNFTGHFQYEPNTNGARIFTFSLSFFCFIMMSTYTANLASFLVVNNTPTLVIDSVEDAVRHGKTFCVWGGAAANEILYSTYPSAKIVRKKDEIDTFIGIRSGECDFALTSMSAWDEFSRNKTANGDCELTWIGRVFHGGEGGFATKSDSGTLCTSLIRDVINIHLEQMEADGFIARAWTDHLERTGGVVCDAASNSEDEESVKMDLKAMGGTFIVHGLLTVVAICVAFFNKYCDRRGQRWNVPLWSQRAAESRALRSSRTKDTLVSESAGIGAVPETLRLSANMDLLVQYENSFQKQSEKMREMLDVMRSMQDEYEALRSKLPRGEEACSDVSENNKRDENCS